MKLPFLRNLPGLSAPSVRRVVVPGTGPLATAAEVALHQLLAELPELLLAAVLEVASGQPLATYAAERSYQPSLLAAPVTAVVRALSASQAPAAEQLCEVVLTLASQLHLTQLAPGGQYLLYLAVESHDTNLALLRQLASQAMTPFNELL